ncbi:hypothetical protein [Paenibacillus sp. GCM10027626]|uniref:GH39 family glycosyl hydrolase n=1 Tax=Paenibacillus sp. GCM10027626 TaxID=3273411 RepID=UPI0036284B8D
MSDIIIRCNERTGAVKKIHGVNNGPVCYGALVDVTKYYKKVDIPLVRLHDPNWPHPREVDIHTVFPDFSKDPADPASYDFSTTDEYIRTVVNTGAEIVYRLGESIEHTAKKYFVHPPENDEKWAQICIGIIRHYNEGWADGFHYGIRYWEIWNEPDNPPAMWSSTPERYYQLYETASLSIKSYNPELKVGGPAVAGSYQTAFMAGFLKYAQERRLPLDFFSWHTYTSDPKMIARNAAHVREQLDLHGYEQAESHFNEWNYFEPNFRVIWQEHSEFIRRRTFERAKGPVGASFVAAVLSILQQAPVDAANYYDGQPTAVFCGLFDYYGAPRTAYRSFEAFYELTKLPQLLAVEIAETAAEIYCCATTDEAGHLAIMISNYEGKTRSYSLELTGLASEQLAGLRMQRFVIDEDHELDLAEERQLGSEQLDLWLPQHSVTLIKLNFN